MFVVNFIKTEYFKQNAVHVYSEYDRYSNKCSMAYI